MPRIIKSISSIEDTLKNRYLSKAYLIENFFSLLLTLNMMVMMFHWLACIFIAIGEYDDPDEDFSWIKVLGYHPIQDKHEVYVNSFYFVVSTATTVGYGDVLSTVWTEKFYVSFLEFIGICVFSIISNKVISLKKEDKINDKVEEVMKEIMDYIYLIDKVRPEVSLSDELYEETIDYIKQSYLHGVVHDLGKNKFFKTLNFQLKDKLVRVLFAKQMNIFEFFFNDYESNNFADKEFIIKVITHLDNRLYHPG